MTTIKFAKVKPNAIIPSKREEDAGFDIYACFADDYIEIAPHETKLIPTGIASNCSKDYCFILKERGSTGTKGLAQRCGVIDSGYTGEWFVPITNTNDYPVYLAKLPYADVFDLSRDYAGIHMSGTVYPYSKAITQALVIPVPKVNVEEVLYEELQSIKSERGMGSLGSSNK